MCDSAVRPKVPSAAEAAQPVTTKSYCESLPHPVPQLKLLPHPLSWPLTVSGSTEVLLGTRSQRIRMLPFYLRKGGLTHHPWLVTEVVNGLQGVDAYCMPMIRWRKSSFSAMPNACCRMSTKSGRKDLERM